MNPDLDTHDLGADVTEAARAPQHRGTSVLSVRLPTDELVEVERLCRASGKTPSQVVRDAIRRYLRAASSSQQLTVTITTFQGTFSTGSPSQCSVPSRATMLVATTETSARGLEG